MKRLQRKVEIQDRYLSADFDEMPGIMESMSESLQLLYHVPLAYLVPQPDYLPPESIRFFYIDPNYIKAMLNGVTAIGRNTEKTKQVDYGILQKLEYETKQGSLNIRTRKVHTNHQDTLINVQPNGSSINTGFLLRSALVQKRKGIVVNGFYHKDPLAILRLETLSQDIMIGIFDGELTSLTIAEPFCGLRFGSYNQEKKKEVLSLKEIGKPIKDQYYQMPTNDKGRLDVRSVVNQMNQSLKDQKEIQSEIGAGIFAYEMLLAAQKAEFFRKGEK